VNSLNLAWNQDVESGFGTADMAANHEADGNRPGDVSIQQQLEQESLALAQQLQGKIIFMC
jgi:hypothetical protein